jgi:site-specific recombinase XerC
MTDDSEEEHDLYNLPKKLSRRISRKPKPSNGKVIIGDGHQELTSAHPVHVVEYFLDLKITDWSVATYDDYSYSLTRFLEYAEYADLDDLSDLSEQNLEGFKQWRKRDEHVALATLHGQLANIRVLIRWCEKVEIVEEGLADEMDLPDLDNSDIVSYTRLSSEAAKKIFEYHEQFEYVDRKFAKFALMWEALLRLGDVRALDLADYNRKEGYINLHHRPEEDTTLKNGESEVEGEGGERKINVPDWVCEILNTYIDGTGDPNHPKRKDETDEYGRKPLFTTQYGRVSKSTVARDIYRITQPCRYGQECPHDEDPESCRKRNNSNHLSKCESVVSPHPVRRGGICHQLNEGVEKSEICERADVSLKVLNKHYDLRTKEEAREKRREELKKHLDGYDSTPAESEDDPSGLEKEVPLLSDGVTAAKDYVESIENMPSRTRAAKGIAGYIVFVALVGLNFSLLGIGF